jgi:hypothetical protein
MILMVSVMRTDEVIRDCVLAAPAEAPSTRAVGFAPFGRSRPELRVSDRLHFFYKKMACAAFPDLSISAPNPAGQVLHPFKLSTKTIKKYRRRMMAAFCACCGAEIGPKAEACPACGTPQHGMVSSPAVNKLLSGKVSDVAGQEIYYGACCWLDSRKEKSAARSKSKAARES